MDKQKRFSSREIVKKAINHENIGGVIKGELTLDDHIIGHVLGCTTVGFEERQHFVDWLGLNIVCLAPTYPDSDNDFPKYSDCPIIDIEKWLGTSLFCFALLDGAFEWGVRIWGFEQFILMIMSDPQKTKGFINQVEEFNLAYINYLAGHGIDGIILADDVAGKDRLLMRPSMFRELFLPSLACQVKRISDNRLPAFFHSDGNYLVLIDDLIQAGFKGLHCIDRNCGMNITALQEQYGNKLCLWGHLSPSDTHFPENSTEMLSLIEEIKQLSLNSGFILGTNSGLFTGISINGLKNLNSKF